MRTKVATPKLIQITDNDVLIDGPSIGDWTQRDSVTVHPETSGGRPSVTMTIVAERVVSDTKWGNHADVNATDPGECVDRTQR